MLTIAWRKHGENVTGNNEVTAMLLTPQNSCCVVIDENVKSFSGGKAIVKEMRLVWAYVSNVHPIISRTNALVWSGCFPSSGSLSSSGPCVGWGDFAACLPNSGWPASELPTQMTPRYRTSIVLHLLICLCSPPICLCGHCGPRQSPEPPCHWDSLIPRHATRWADS